MIRRSRCGEETVRLLQGHGWRWVHDFFGAAFVRCSFLVRLYLGYLAKDRQQAVRMDLDVRQVSAIHADTHTHP